VIDMTSEFRRVVMPQDSRTAWTLTPPLATRCDQPPGNCHAGIILTGRPVKCQMNNWGRSSVDPHPSRTRTTPSLARVALDETALWHPQAPLRSNPFTQGSRESAESLTSRAEGAVRFSNPNVTDKIR